MLHFFVFQTQPLSQVNIKFVGRNLLRESKSGTADVTYSFTLSNDFVLIRVTHPCPHPQSTGCRWETPPVGYQVFEGQHAHTIIPFGGNLSWLVYLLACFLDMGVNDKIKIHRNFTQSTEFRPSKLLCFLTLLPSNKHLRQQQKKRSFYDIQYASSVVSSGKIINLLAQYFHQQHRHKTMYKFPHSNW